MVGVLAALYRGQRALTSTGIILLALVPVFVVLTFVDTRTVDGFSVWIKPIKFSASLGLYALTLAFFARWMRGEDAVSRGFKVVMAAFLAAIVYESLWLYAAAAFGVRSHYNMDGGLFSALYALAGVFAVILIVPALTMGISVLRARKEARNRAMATAIGWGLVLTFVLTLVATAGLTNPFGDFGGSKEGYGEGLFGWRVKGGDLRAAHFFATHALHVVPLVMFPISRIFPAAFGALLARLTAAAYSVVVVLLVLSTLRGDDLPGLLVFPL